MKNITININGINSKQAKAFQQMADRLEQIATIKETILKNSKKSSTVFFSYMYKSKLKNIDIKKHEHLREILALNYDVNFCIINLYTKKQILHFSAIDNNNMCESIAYVFYHLRNY